MKTSAVFIMTVLVFGSPAAAWNETGHMVVARLAWQNLTPAQQKATAAILKVHPHYGEYFMDAKPENVPEDEWLFARAAYWPDWVRDHHSAQYSRPEWHYVGLPFVPSGSKFDLKSVPPQPVSVVTQLPICMERLKRGSPLEKAIYLCWLEHLVGDIHQPLHCATLYSEQFPSGDKVATLSLVRIGGNKVQLHLFWDALLGTSPAWDSVEKSVQEVRAVEPSIRGRIEQARKVGNAPDSWAAEGHVLAKQAGYLDGRLKVANADERPTAEAIPPVPADYALNSALLAKRRAAIAAWRLADCVAECVKSEE